MSTTWNSCVSVIGSIFIGIAIGVCAYIVTDYLGERKKRHQYSALASAIVAGLLEEIKTGIQIMEAIKKAVLSDRSQHTSTLSSPSSGSPIASQAHPLLPCKSWNGMNTFSDGVLLRMVAVNADKATDIRSDCKNYFEHACGSLNSIISDPNSPPTTKYGELYEDYLQGDGNYLASAVELKKDLEELRVLLDSNARALFPN